MRLGCVTDLPVDDSCHLNRKSISAMDPYRRLVAFFFALFLLHWGGPGPVTRAVAVEPGPVETEWGGHLRLRSGLGWPDERSVFHPHGTDPLVDGAIDFRLKNQMFFGSRADVKTHYEIIASGGDTRKKTGALAGALPAALASAGPVNDSRRLMDLTATIDEADGHVVYHRLDRLVISLRSDAGALSLGRQALTWGNGMLFNPMDLFNPFAPTDTDRDYKVGDDMVLARGDVPGLGDLQVLYVPRRDAGTGDLSWDRSSLAAKAHRASGSVEIDLMAARHYRDYVLGAGASGYLADAAWRADVTWTRLFGQGGRAEFFSLVVNLDYSWILGGKNWYGFVEVFHNGLGRDEAADALVDPLMADRLERGELFTLGRTYLAGQVRCEVHPLVNLYLNAITNGAGPSGILQPRAVWDPAQNLQVTLGGAAYWGRSNTEYGGFRVPPTGVWCHSPDTAYLRISAYF